MRDGRARGCRTFELDVLSDNPATGFYRAQGLELLVESRAPDQRESAWCTAGVAHGLLALASNQNKGSDPSVQIQGGWGAEPEYGV